jgi:hypothetical protein
MLDDDFAFDDLAIAISTVNRSPQYVHQTLASLFAADPAVHRAGPVWVVVDSQDAAYLKEYSHHRLLRVQPLSESEAAESGGWAIHRRACRNYQRCLTLPLEGKKGVLVCEDDVVFRDLFLTRLVLTIQEMRSDRLEQYALALFASHDFEGDASFYRGKLYCSYGWEYYGSQAMYFPSAMARSVATLIDDYGVNRFVEPYDLTIKRACGGLMYACARPLCQHVGEVSTGLGGCSRAPGFTRPFRPLSRGDWGKKT